jgi:hypothetical protein
MAFCDFCTCHGCVSGALSWFHAQTEDGRWICDVCYEYTMCIRAKHKEGIHDGPCDDYQCGHRPKLVTGWVLFKVPGSPRWAYRSLG